MHDLLEPKDIIVECASIWIGRILVGGFFNAIRRNKLEHGYNATMCFFPWIFNNINTKLNNITRWNLICLRWFDSLAIDERSIAAAGVLHFQIKIDCNCVYVTHLIWISVLLILPWWKIFHPHTKWWHDFVITLCNRILHWNLQRDFVEPNAQL